MEEKECTMVIQALLFAAGKPLPSRNIARYLNISHEEVIQRLAILQECMNTKYSGIHIMFSPEGYQMVTNPEATEIGTMLSKSEPGELTRPSLETLTVIAYRGPLTRAELEAIRGVQCALILRNLLMRGLILEREGDEPENSVYTLSGDTLKFLGVHSEKELPDYATFHSDIRLTKLVDALEGI